jgi:polar amino acid transport system permease protein
MLRSRSFWVSALSTLVVVVVLGVLVATAPGMGLVRQTFFSSEHFRASVGQVWDGFKINLRMMVIAEVLVLAFALLIAVVRGLPGPAAFPFRVLAIVYTDLFRGVPTILMAFLIGLGIPALDLGYISHLSAFTYGVITLVLVYSAYVTEVYRAGIESVHGSQTAAARSLGLSHWQSLRYVVLPQAVRRVVPPLLNDFIGLQKDTALVSFIGVVEVLQAANDYATQTLNFTGLTVAASLFILITIPLTRFTDYLIARDRRRRRGGP